MLRPIMSERSKTAKIILVLYWGFGCNRSHQYSTKTNFAVLDVSFIMGLNIGETDKVFYIDICCFCRKALPNLASLSHSAAKI